MAVLKIILTVVFIIISIALTVIILMQESKSAGLGAIAGAADTYWGKNKGRSMEGRLVTGTKILVALFIVIAAVLNLGIFLRNAKDCREYDGLFFIILKMIAYFRKMEKI